MRKLLPILWILLLAPHHLPLAAQVQTNRIAILVGISKYPDVEGIPGLQFADKDARLFERYLRTQRGGGFDRVIVLLEEKATRAAILAAVRQAVVTAGPSGQVYLFLSARGRATETAPEGIIYTFESRDEKNTSIALSELRQALQAARGPEILLFADLCRVPPEWQPVDNRINIRLEEMGRSIARLTGLLASEPMQRSHEDQALQQGHGVFTYFMVDGLQGRAPALDANRDNRIDLGEMFAYLRNEMPKNPQYQRQRPRLFGARAPVPALADLTRPVSRNGFFRYPGLLASAEPFPLLFQSTIEIQRAFDQALSEFRPDGASNAADLLENLRPLLRPEEWQLESERLAAAFEGEGQQIFLRYGVGDRFPDDPEWRNLELTPADYLRAERAFREALRFRPRDASLEARALFCAGRAAALGGDTQTAQQRFQEAISLDASLPEAHNALGVIRLEAGNYDDAVREFRLALGAAPRWAFPRHNLALTYMERGDYLAAEREYASAIAATPYYPYLQYNLGFLHHRLSRRRQAERAYRAAIDAFQRQTSAFNIRAGQWRALGNPAEADRARAFASVLRKNEGEAHNGLAILHESRGNRSRAMAEYDLALRNNPNLLAARHNLALLYRDRKNPVQAQQLWMENLRIDPRFLPSRLSIAEAYLMSLNYSDAEIHYRDAVSAEPEHAGARHGLALVLAGQGRIPEAIEQENKAIEIQARNSSALASGRFYESLGDLYQRLGDKGKACEQYRLAEKGAKTSIDGPSKQLAQKIKETCR